MQREKCVPRKCVLIICAAVAALLLASCGSSSSSSSSSTPPVSGIKKRVLLTNSLVNPSTTAGLIIVDAKKDTLARSVSSAEYGKILTASGTTVLLNVASNQISIFKNSTEQITSSPTLITQAFDIALSTDGLTTYAAVRDSGRVEVIGTASGNIVSNITVPSVTRLFEGPQQHTLLAFADDPQNLVGTTNGVSNANSFFVINPSNNTVAAVPLPAGSQPYSAVFDPSDANDTTAFILNCGSGCGGSNPPGAPVPPGVPVPPSVVKVNFSNPAAPVFSTPIPVSAATVGLLNGSSLFVAGTPAGSSQGTLQIIDTNALTAGAPIAITNGLHTLMTMTSNNRLYIGASNCTIGTATNNQVAGCLTIFNTSTQAVTVPLESSLRQNFNVTGMQPISGRNIIYVCQGGELDFFDITLDAVSPSVTQQDVIGNAFGVVQIDP
jgi:hypothetical protein